jgi:hypothetical protein
MYCDTIRIDLEIDEIQEDRLSVITRHANHLLRLRILLDMPHGQWPRRNLSLAVVEM